MSNFKEGNKTVWQNVFYLRLILLFIHMSSRKSHGFHPVCHPDSGTCSLVRREKPRAPGPVYNLTVVWEDTQDVIIFSVDILQVLSLTFLRALSPSSFHTGLYSQPIAHSHPSNRLLTCPKI